jgi:hypothetical protein
MPDRLYFTLIPFFAAGVALHIWDPRRVLPCWCMAIPLGILLLTAAALLVIPARKEQTTSAWGPPLVLAYLAATALMNSLWPLVMLLPALILIVKWRAIQVQTGRRPPPND